MAAAEVNRMEYAGIDVGTRACSASVVDEAGEIKTYVEIENRGEGWEQLVEALQLETRVVLEASTAAYPIYDYLCEVGFDVVMANPSQIRAITASKSKTDEKDSLILAQLLRLDYVPRSYVPTPEIMRNRELLRACVDVGQEICRTKNRIHALLTKSGLRPEYGDSRSLFRTEKRMRWLRSVRFGDHRDAVLQSYMMHLESLQREQEVLKGEVARTARASEDVDLLMSIKGVDYYAALIVLSEIGDVRRFRNAEALCAYAGMVPRVRQSADVVSHGRITKQGPGTLRWVLDLVAQVVIRYDNPMRAYYRRLVRRKKKKSVALTAVARKVLVMMYAMLTRRERCRWEDPDLTDRKVERMRRACERKVFPG
jgi:transposase